MRKLGEMSDRNDRHFIRGERAVYRRLLSFALKGLGADDAPDDLAQAHLRIVRLESHLADVRAQLRMLCDDFGDNDWEDDLHLADVIDKHLGDHLHGRDAEAVGIVRRLRAQFGSAMTEAQRNEVDSFLSECD